MGITNWLQVMHPALLILVQFSLNYSDPTPSNACKWGEKAHLLQLLLLLNSDGLLVPHYKTL